MAAEDELETVRRAQAGDAAALDHIVRSHWERVYRLLGRIWGARPDLEDLVQTTFLELLGALPGFRGDSQLSTFISAIAIRVARRAGRPALVVRHRVSADALDGKASGLSGPDAQAVELEALRRARLILERVAEPKRVAFLLWALEGMQVEEVAEGMQASVAATRSRIYYAQKELLQAAEKDPYLRDWLAGGERHG